MILELKLKEQEKIILKQLLLERIIKLNENIKEWETNETVVKYEKEQIKITKNLYKKLGL